MMKKTILLTCLLVLTMPLMAAKKSKTEAWVIDQAHTKVGFEISHLIISSVEGKFNDFKGEIMFDPHNRTNVKSFKFSTTIETNSIDTGNEARDKHLRSADFFEVKKHKTITFISKKVTSSDGTKFNVQGDLTIAGKTKPVTIKMKFKGLADAYDISRIAFEGEAEIDRRDFGLTWNDGEVKATNVAGKLAEAAGAVGNDVEISLKIQAKRKADLD